MFPKLVDKARRRHELDVRLNFALSAIAGVGVRNETAVCSPRIKFLH